MSFPRFAILAVNLTHLKPGKQSLYDREILQLSFKSSYGKKCEL